MAGCDEEMLREAEDRAARLLDDLCRQRADLAVERTRLKGEALRHGQAAVDAAIGSLERLVAALAAERTGTAAEPPEESIQRHVTRPADSA